MLLPDTIQVQESFSPLFIGAGGVTLPAGTAAVYYHPSFSPLFIGAGGVTYTFFVNNSYVVTFQSPIHRGWRCNAMTSGIKIVHHCRVSVPYSSGLAV